jgi:ParB-like partition proteins
MAKEPKKSLGRGIGALIPGAQASGSSSFMKKDNSEKVLMLAIEQIKRDADQPRENFDPAELEELADSIRVNGLIQPIIVRRDGDVYKIIAGERRWRAAQQAGLKEIAAIVREVTNEQAAVLALVENLQRSDLNPIEEAKGYQRLIQDYGKSHEQIAEKVGKERSSITNSLRLLNLPDTVQDALISRKLNMGHARALLGLEDEQSILSAAREVMQKNLSVRATEQLVHRQKEGKLTASSSGKSKKAAVESVSPQIRSLTEQLQRALGTKVHIEEGKSGSGQIEILYFSAAGLESILDKLIPDRD